MRRRDLLSGVFWTGATIPAAPLLAAAAAPRVVVNRVTLMGRRVVTPVTIGNAPPELFLLDTGANVSLIDDALARSLKLAVRGETVLSGIGGAARMPIYLARNVVLGGALHQNDVAFAGITRGFTGEIRGALAAGVLTAIDSDLDLEAGEWRLYPDGRPDRAGYVRMERGIGFTLGPSSPRLYGDAEVNGRRLRFLLDTGAPGALSLHHEVAKRLGLWDDARPYAPQRTSGIGGPGGLGRLVRADSLTFAGRTFERPIVLLRRDGDLQGLDGIIGLDLLRGFNLSTEIRERALWVQPHRVPAPLSNNHGPSGLWIDQDGSALTIAAVGTGSPAAAAGLKVGDRVLGESFPALLRKIGGNPGQMVRLDTERTGQRRSVEFTVANYL